MAKGFQTALALSCLGEERKGQNTLVRGRGQGQEKDGIPKNKIHCPMLREDAFAVSLLAARAGLDKSASV